MTVLPPRDWTCEKCTDILVRIFTYLADPATIAVAVTYLQGDCFCGAAGHTADCPVLVETVLPLALPVLAQELTEKTDHLCQEAIGVC